MFKKPTKTVELTKAEMTTPFGTAFRGGIYSALGSIAAAELFELLSTCVKIIGDKVVEKINDRKEIQNVNEQFWDELFDDKETEEEEE